jgi:tripartite-type tricarboxylate transporter receptor subunit TctC
MTKAKIIFLCLFLFHSLSWGQRAADTYPNKPIRLIVPLAAGSSVDTAARIVMQKMSQNIGQPIIIENRLGAAGIIGTDQVAKSPADGYTLGGFNDSIITMIPNLNSKLPWDIVKDFESISQVAIIEWGLMVSANSPYRNVNDLIEAAKKSPGKLNYSSGGNGGPQHIGMAMLAYQAGVNMMHVPYKGATQAAVGAAAGEVDATLQGISTIVPLVQGNKARLIAVCTPQRMAQFPDVPTVSESGIPSFKMNSWFGLMAPAGTPKEIIAFLNREVTKALADPNVKERLITLGLFPVGSSADEMSSLVKSQLEHYRKVITQAGIKAD